jgi:chorismate mutase
MSLNGKSLKKFIPLVITYGPLIVLVIQTIIIGVELNQKNINQLRIAWLLISMVPPSIIFLIVKSYEDNVTYSKIQDELEKIRNDIKNFDNASVEVFKKRDDFYKKISEERSKANSIVQLTLLDPYSPYKEMKNNARKDYFNADIENIKKLKEKNVSFYRILSIETEEKWDWIKEFIEKTKELDNVFLAYIKVGDIEKSIPFPKLLSLQIIDKEKMFMLNPKCSYMPDNYENNYCYYLENKGVAEIYVDYYNRVWDSLKNNSEYGCILKEGRKNNEKKMTDILKYIRENNNENPKTWFKKA